MHVSIMGITTSRDETLYGHSEEDVFEQSEGTFAYVSNKCEEWVKAEISEFISRMSDTEGVTVGKSSIRGVTVRWFRFDDEGCVRRLLEDRFGRWKDALKRADALTVDEFCSYRFTSAAREIELAGDCIDYYVCADGDCRPMTLGAYLRGLRDVVGVKQYVFDAMDGCI